MTVEEIKQKALEVQDIIRGTTVNERLWISGLMEEFEMAMESDQEHAKLILSFLQVGEENIEEILEQRDRPPNNH